MKVYHTWSGNKRRLSPSRSQLHDWNYILVSAENTIQLIVTHPSVVQSEVHKNTAGRKLYKHHPIHSVAKEHGIKICCSYGLNVTYFHSYRRKCLAIFIRNCTLKPPTILNVAKTGCWNIYTYILVRLHGTNIEHTTNLLNACLNLLGL